MVLLGGLHFPNLRKALDVMRKYFVTALLIDTTAASFQLSDRMCTATPSDITLIEQ